MNSVSEKFRPKKPFLYPKNNLEIFEEFFFRQYSQRKNDRIYLPIFWTSYYIKNNYGLGDLSELQNYLDSLDRTKKYFTIVQYDDNILNNIQDLDILIFCQGGYGKNKDKSYPIPLIYEKKIISGCDKKIFSSFIGRKTHTVRNLIFDNFQKNKKFLIIEDSNNIDYNKIMCESIFSLCPRGYGLTSFRICESLMNESIPVYIYDEEFNILSDYLNFEQIGIKIHKDDIVNIEKILSQISLDEINQLLENGKKYYKKYFTYHGLYETILKILEKV